MKTLFIVLTIMSILSQIPHAYWAIETFSQIKNKTMRVLQNVVFCSIISIGILGFALQGKHLHALIGAIIEIVINIYYYQVSFESADKRKSASKQKTWLAWFLAFLIPFSIFFFSLEIKGE